MTETIVEAMECDNESKVKSVIVFEQMLGEEILYLCHECIDELLIEEEIEGMVDEVLEKEIWKESIKEIKEEEQATKEIMDEITNDLTRRFFLDHFNEIKKDYLIEYKEYLARKEKEEEK